MLVAFKKLDVEIASAELLSAKYRLSKVGVSGLAAARCWRQSRWRHQLDAFICRGAEVLQAVRPRVLPKPVCSAGLTRSADQRIGELARRVAWRAFVATVNEITVDAKHLAGQG